MPISPGTLVLSALEAEIRDSEVLNQGIERVPIPSVPAFIPPPTAAPFPSPASPP